SLGRGLAGRWLFAPTEQYEMCSLGLIEPQRPCKRFEHVERSAHVASLLEPRVPGCAYAREVCDLLATQAWGSPATSVRQAHVLGLKGAAPGTQEVRELVAAPRSRARSIGFARRRRAPPPRASGGRSLRGGTSWYQDNALSSTWISIVAQ